MAAAATLHHCGVFRVAAIVTLYFGDIVLCLLRHFVGSSVQIAHTPVVCGEGLVYIAIVLIE